MSGVVTLYCIGLSVLLALAGPFLLLFKKKARAGLWQKLGFVPACVSPKGSLPRIWFHTVSVGEFNATLPLIQRFHGLHPEFEIFISTTTATGQALAREKAGHMATVFYFPFDLPAAFNPWLCRVQPDIVAIAETEIWPAFAVQCRRRGIKLVAVNARISPRSFRRYLSLKSFLQPVMRSYRAIAAQSPQEAQRYVELGALPEQVHVCGNMKFDGMQAIALEEQAALRRKLKIKEDEPVLVAGSTHEGEEAAVLAALNAVPALRLIIAPRHPERFQRVYQVVESHGFRARCYSRHEAFERENDVFVLDTIGQLQRFYCLSTIAFVGGTLAPIGGHNLVEPCIYSTPVICGPHVEKTREVKAALSERQAIVQVQDGAELVRAVQALVTDPGRRLALGNAGRQFLADSQGAVTRTMDMLSSVVKGDRAHLEGMSALAGQVAHSGAAAGGKQ